jgi:hypothetical protein
LTDLTFGQRTARVLSLVEFQALADVPPAVAWFANIDNPQTRRAYQNDLTEFMAFAGIDQPEQFDSGRGQAKVHAFINETKQESVLLTTFPCAECGASVTPDTAQDRILDTPVRHGVQFGTCPNCGSAHMIMSASTKVDCIALLAVCPTDRRPSRRVEHNADICSGPEVWRRMARCGKQIGYGGAVRDCSRRDKCHPQAPAS